MTKKLPSTPEIVVEFPDSEAPFFSQVPGSKCEAPRDDKPLQKTEDVLFLAMLLKRTEPTQQILETMDSNGVRHYLPESRVEGADFSATGSQIKSRISRPTVRKLFREQFYGFRRALSSNTPLRIELTLASEIVKSHGDPGNTNLWNYGSTLTHPFSDKGDPLLADLHKHRFFEWEEEAGLTLPKGYFYCPLDGPVQPIEASMKTPPESWRVLCGREWTFALCCDCLGVFTSRVTRMN